MGLSAQSKKATFPVWEICLYAILGAIMFCSKILMEALPNIHLLGMLTVTYTLVFRKKALIPIYIYVLLDGLFSGFSVWWIPYLYLWTILWGVSMLLPKTMAKRTAAIVYPIVCCLHGLLFGILYSPAQILLFRLDRTEAIAWIVAGFPYDLLHGIGNLVAGFLILPLSELLKKLIIQRIPSSNGMKS